VSPFKLVAITEETAESNKAVDQVAKSTVTLWTVISLCSGKQGLATGIAFVADTLKVHAFLQKLKSRRLYALTVIMAVSLYLAVGVERQDLPVALG
jgi:hypothetical protein